MAVELIEPNDININRNIVNGIPQYQDMYIFAELTAIRKGRTVLVTNGNNDFEIEPTGFENNTIINLIGNNQDKNSPNYLKFTTNYYDGSTGDNIQYEGFGMNNIKVIINSSFIPQVNIQFIDVRGLAFFNRENSPYRILFDFPPPVFTLTLKGYYGKAIKYRLHLVKYTSEFKSENGNFVIDAQFVAITFAPLSDVLFRYVVNFPLINNEVSMTPDTGVPPTNTYELILKLKNLYSSIADKIETDIDSKEYDNVLNQITQNTSTISILSNHNKFFEQFGYGNLYTIIKTETSPSNEYRLSYGGLIDTTTNINDEAVINPINNLNEYDSIIKEFSVDGIPVNNNKKLYLVYFVGVDSNVNTSNTINLLSNENKLKTALNEFKKYLINITSNAITTQKITNGDISDAKVIIGNYDVTTQKDTNLSTKYIGIDVTDFYVKLYKNKFVLEKSRLDISKRLNTKINNSILNELGMKPTIYNIFKIILDDVDTFFKTLRKTSNDAEIHHNIPEIQNQIFGDNYVDSLKKIFAFPLMIKREKIGGGDREVRIAPIELNKKMESNPFPEISLIEDFIDTFNNQIKIAKIFNTKSELNEDGSYKWIPISPIDSILANTSTISPYTTSKLSPDDFFTQLIKVAVKRFYILSQSSYPTSFYNNSENAYIKLYAESEAINIATAINSSKSGDNVYEFANKYRNNIEDFYGVLDNFNLYDFTEDERESFSILGNDDSNIQILGAKDAYIDKTNSNYQGLSLYDDVIKEQILNVNSEKPIDIFQTEFLETFMKNISLKDANPESIYCFTEENLIYIKDSNDSVKNNIETRFLTKPTLFENLRESKIIELIETLSNVGNKGFRENVFLNEESAKIKLQLFDNVIDTWVDQLSKHDIEIHDDIISNQSKLSALIFLSNFGNTLSPFNEYPKNLNKYIFNNPAAIDVPAYLSLYIGALVDAKIDGFDDVIKEFFVNGSGKFLSSSGLFILADITDIENNLSTNDKTVFKNAFNSFFTSNSTSKYLDILSQIKNLYNEVNNSSEDKETKYKETKYKETKYKELLKSGGKYFSRIIQPLTEKTTILNFSQITFKNEPTTQTGYQSLKTINLNSTKKAINENYFKKFFNKLINEIGFERKKLIDEEEKNKKLKGDVDIVSQTYYSFKNINDKWLTDPNNNVIDGYPFNNEGKNLIDLFVFVDRAMNPIGDTIINAETLIQMFEDTDISVFSVLTQLLSLNGFEFFPLQNFMNFQNDEWMESFKIDTSGNVKQEPTFVCMFIGGTSSYPTGIGKNSDFKDDSIVDIGNTDARDFQTIDDATVNINDDNQVEGNKNFPWRQVKAFRVRYGEQNQSMFSDIKIDSKEYPETNESIQILSRLAGDNKLQAPVPKGQNLYNLYENRAYKATINGLGNVMIQPTQYFQLENVPLFNGAYLILAVEHTIEQNMMKTSFSGTKILRYPVPRVLNPAAIAGFEGGDSDNTDVNTMSGNQITSGTDIINNDRIKYNSMYTFKIE